MTTPTEGAGAAGRRPTRRRVAPALAALCCTGLVPGQPPTTPPATPNAPAPAPVGAEQAPGQAERRLYDKVVGIIGDTVILQSTIDHDLAQRFPAGQPVDEERRQLEEMNILRRIARDEIWVQYGKILGKQAPEEFEEIVDREVQKYMDEQVSRYGSVQKMTEELESVGLSWQALKDDYRKGLLRDIALSQAFGGKFRNQSPLLVTPKEMLRFYREHADRFAAYSTVDLAWINFTGSGSGGGGAQARAQQAADAWRQGDEDEKEIAKRFEGIELPRMLDIRPDDDHADFVKTFATENDEGTVSDPITRSPSCFVLKVARKVSVEARGFSDPLVQDEIRHELTARKREELNARVLLRNSQKLLIWPEWLLHEAVSPRAR